GADREGAVPRRRQHGDALRGAVEFLKCFLQLHSNGAADGVEPVGSVDADDRDRPQLFHGNNGHNVSFVQSSSARASTITQRSPRAGPGKALRRTARTRSRRSGASQPRRTTASTTASTSSGGRPRKPSSSV